MHMDTDVAMEMGGLGMSPSRTGTHLTMPWREALPEQPRVLTALDLVSSITRGMTAAATEILEKFTRPPPVDDVADAAIRECFQQRRATTGQEYKFILAGMESSARVSAFYRLGHWAQTPQKEQDWEPCSEMTPQKIERGCQISHPNGLEPRHSTSQNRRSKSRPRGEGEPKKGWTDNEGQNNKVQVGIDWSTMGIQKPVSKPDPRHPPFKPDLSETGEDQQPRLKSAVVPKGSQKSGERTSNKTSGLTDPEKIELKEKPYNWIPAWVNRLDPKGYMEEIHSFMHFGRKSKTFALEIIAIADWGRKCFDVGLQFPIPVFPHYLFNEFARSRQGCGQIPTKPDYLAKAGGTSRPRVWKDGSGWPPSCNSGQTRPQSPTASCLGVEFAPPVL